MEQYFLTKFEDIRHEREVIIILPLPEPDMLKQNKSTDHVTIYDKNLAPEKLHRQTMLKQYTALK